VTWLSIDHHGVRVPDLAAAVVFFRDVIGHEVLYEHSYYWGAGPDEENFWIRTGRAPAQTRLSLAMLRLGNGPGLELIQIEFPAGDADGDSPATPFDPTHGHAAHLSLQVTDIDAATAYLRGHGLEATDPTVDEHGRTSSQFRTPWGQALELTVEPDELEPGRWSPSRPETWDGSRGRPEYLDWPAEVRGIHTIRGTDHLGMLAGDVDEATGFFIGGFGCREIGRASDAAGATTVMLRCGNGNLEVIQASEAPFPATVRSAHPGARVDDIGAAIAAAKRHSAQIQSDAITMDPMWGPESGAGALSLHLSAPWGQDLELVQYPEGRRFENEFPGRAWVPDDPASWRLPDAR
jgi:catechol 2,3-dioxygenase-like lactoylglutathione lyase family enzyme